MQSKGKDCQPEEGEPSFTSMLFIKVILVDTELETE